MKALFRWMCVASLLTMAVAQDKPAPATFEVADAHLSTGLRLRPPAMACWELTRARNSRRTQLPPGGASASGLPLKEAVEKRNADNVALYTFQTDPKRGTRLGDYSTKRPPEGYGSTLPASKALSQAEVRGQGLALGN